MRAALPLLILALSAAAPAGQQPGGIVGGVVPGIPAQRTPPRDPRPAPVHKVGSGIVRGMVAAATGQPLGRAIVTLSGSSGSATAITDEQGRFEFVQLPAGRYTVTARKNLYLQGGYKQRRPNGPSEPVDVADGQVQNVAITLVRYSAITGRVVDPYGEPAMNVQVHVIAAAGSGRSRRPQRRSMTSTNDIGEFRLAHLEPGPYIVCAVPGVGGRRGMGPRFAEGPAGRTPIGSVAIGVVTPGTGGGIVGSFPGGMPDETGSGVPTCYPSADLSQGQPIHLPAGDDARDINIMLRAGATGDISGIVVDASGQSVTRASVTLLARFGANTDPWMHVGGSGVRPDTGQFSFEGIAPGEYMLEAMVFNPGGGERGPRDEQRGYLPITVGGGNQEGLVITVGNLATVAGRVVFEQAGDRKPPARVRLITTPMGDGERVRTATVETEADYRFELRNLFGAQYLSASESGGFRLKSITHRGSNLLDVPIDFKPGTRMTDVEVVFTGQTTLIEGSIAGATNPAPGEYLVLLFAQDPEKWRPRSRYVRSGFIDRTTGRFRIESAPPEQYYIAAWRRADVDVAFEDMYEPEFLDRLKSIATPVAVIEGDRRELSLTPITLPDR